MIATIMALFVLLLGACAFIVIFNWQQTDNDRKRAYRLFDKGLNHKMRDPPPTPDRYVWLQAGGALYEALWDGHNFLTFEPIPPPDGWVYATGYANEIMRWKFEKTALSTLYKI